MESLANANNELSEAGKDWAQTEHAYRQARAVAYLGIVTDSERRTVDHIKAMVDIKCDNQMLRARLAEARREAAFQLVQSRRSELSAAQSLLRREIEEAAAVKYGQTAGA
jgi:hypothetical protein